jgi:pimeloyl-ACP methyl ester carboxylesterase
MRVQAPSVADSTELEGSGRGGLGGAGARTESGFGNIADVVAMDAWRGGVVVISRLPLCRIGTGMAVRLGCLLTALVLASTACGGQPATTAPTQTGAPQGAASGPLAPRADAAGIVWLCLPGKADNPCAATLTTTVIDASGKRTVEKMTPAADPPIDCFYLYPTTSLQTTMNADLSIDPELVTIATWQAAPFSKVCKVYAPIYPQLTIAALSGGGDKTVGLATAYSGALSAFDDYMANYNKGRGIVFIGHSQGAMLLISLLQDRLETAPEVRKLLVSALLLGGSATTAPGKTTGGDFNEIPTCASTTQTGCVVGYSSFDETPPEDAMFGRTATAVGMLRRPQPGEQLMCVNPTAVGGKGTMKPLIAASDLPRLTAEPPKPLPNTTFVTYPNAYAAECNTNADGSWLQVSRIGPAAAAPKLVGTEGRSWGLHDFDVSLSLGNLLDLVAAESSTYVK